MHRLLYNCLLCVGKGNSVADKDATIQTNSSIVANRERNIDDRGISTHCSGSIVHILEQEEEHPSHKGKEGDENRCRIIHHVAMGASILMGFMWSRRGCPSSRMPSTKGVPNRTTRRNTSWR